MFDDVDFVVVGCFTRVLFHLVFLCNFFTRFIWISWHCDEKDRSHPPPLDRPLPERSDRLTMAAHSISSQISTIESNPRYDFQLNEELNYLTIRPSHPNVILIAPQDGASITAPYPVEAVVTTFSQAFEVLCQANLDATAAGQERNQWLLILVGGTHIDGLGRHIYARVTDLENPENLRVEIVGTQNVRVVFTPTGTAITITGHWVFKNLRVFDFREVSDRYGASFRVNGGEIEVDGVKMYGQGPAFFLLRTGKGKFANSSFAGGVYGVFDATSSTVFMKNCRVVGEKPDASLARSKWMTFIRGGSISASDCHFVTCTPVCLTNAARGIFNSCHFTGTYTALETKYGIDLRNGFYPMAIFLQLGSSVGCSRCSFDRFFVGVGMTDDQSSASLTQCRITRTGIPLNLQQCRKGSLTHSELSETACLLLAERCGRGQVECNSNKLASSAQRFFFTDKSSLNVQHDVNNAIHVVMSLCCGFKFLAQKISSHAVPFEIIGPEKRDNLQFLRAKLKNNCGRCNGSDRPVLRNLENST